MNRWRIVLLAAALAACTPTDGGQRVAEPAASALSIRIGESIFEVARRVPALVRIDALDDNAPATITVPTRLTVVVDDQQVTLPPTRFVRVRQVAGQVVGLDTSPMLAFASLADCHALATSLVGRAQEVGWQPVEVYRSDLGEMTADVAKAARPRYEKTYAVLRRGNVRLRVYVKEAIGGGLEGSDPPARGNLFLLNTDFADPVLDDEANKRLFAKRRESTGGTDALPLRAWLPKE